MTIVLAIVANSNLQNQCQARFFNCGMTQRVLVHSAIEEPICLRSDIMPLRQWFNHGMQIWPIDITFEANNCAAILCAYDLILCIAHTNKETDMKRRRIGLVCFKNKLFLAWYWVENTIPILHVILRNSQEEGHRPRRSIRIFKVKRRLCTIDK